MAWQLLKSEPPSKKDKVMESINFEFLRKNNPELAELGAFAERYAYSDPASSLVKLRTFAEYMVTSIFSHYNFYQPFQASFIDLLNDASFKHAIPSVVISKLHALRINGNKAAHGTKNHLSDQTALCMTKEAHSLGIWFFLSVCGGNKAECNEFKQPEKEEEVKSKLDKQNQAVIKQLAQQEAQMTKLLEDLDNARKQAVKEKKSKHELEKILKASQKVADTLDFDEATTRSLLIDELLINAGWKVGEGNKSTNEVGKEVELKYQPTKSGIGYADYVLWDDNGKPLAVIEAKKTSTSAEIGKKQALDYAHSLAKMYDQRPVIFFTNGYDIFIWEDAKGDPPRKIYGFYSKDSLQYCLYQTKHRSSVKDLASKREIIDRTYQIEAIKRVCEIFSSHKRRTLVVQATGTGKTRVAIGLCELLTRAEWAKRILFLCDRRELRKQAHNTFKEFLPSEPRVNVRRSTYNDKDKRIYLSTYPAMIKCYNNFDVGFFDLIIADESHRSIYNRYRDLFIYFDALQVGLTATPVNYIARNTFKLFDCEDEDPTFNYSYEDAINHNPPYLVPFKVIKHTTKFLRKGIKYKDMTKEQQEELELQVEEPELIDYTKEEVDKKVFNKDTDRHIIRNLMENGIRNADNTSIGKSMIFARSHKHAIILNTLFDEMYPQYGGKFCQVIDNYEPRAEQLIDDFKNINHELTIAISVDMLDTGIDIPEVVNLVFAKPVKSYVKFWQMIGRGTRLCKDLLGPGKDKSYFQIFDHWGNFEYFDELVEEEEPARSKSLLEQLFETRVNLASEAIINQDVDTLQYVIGQIQNDISSLPERSIAVKEKWREIKSVENKSVLDNFSAATKSVLINDITPLMQWRNTEKEEPAYRFDLLIAKTQSAHLNQTSELENYRDNVKEQVSRLPITINVVKQKIEIINKIKSKEFWQADKLSVNELENIRTELRGVMKYRESITYEPEEPRILDIRDQHAEYNVHKVKLNNKDMIAYRERVTRIFNEIFEKSSALQKVKAGKPVTDEEIKDLSKKVSFLDPSFNLEDILGTTTVKADRIDQAIRQIVGLEPKKVEEFFVNFMQKYPEMTAHQIRFLDLLRNHISKYGALKIDKLWDAPFTILSSDGIDGVFEEDQVNEIIKLVNNINQYAPVA